MIRIGMMRAVAAGALLTLGAAGNAGAQEGLPTVEDLTAAIAAQVADGISLSGGGGSTIATGTVRSGGDEGIVSADGGNSLATGDNPGGADGSGAFATNQ